MFQASFDPTISTCPFEKELWEEQSAYLWTVVWYVLKNSLGKACISDHMKDRDPRATYLQHEELQRNSPSRIYLKGQYLDTLNALSIGSFEGNRVDFITTWFESLRLVNDFSDENNQMGFDMVASLLLRAVDTDDKLPDVFTDLTSTLNDTVDLDTHKAEMLKRAALSDGKESFLKRNSKKKRSVNSTDLTEIFYDTEETEFQQTLREFAAFRSTRGTNPNARMPDHMYNTFEQDDKTNWRHMPESTRVKIVQMINTLSNSKTTSTANPARPALPPDRRAYSSERQPSIPQELGCYSEPSELTDEVQDFRRILVNATDSSPTVASTSSDSSGTRPPSKSILKISKSHKAPPKLSTLGPAHPAVILANKTTQLYDREGNHKGFINEPQRNIDAGFHRWLNTNDENDYIELDEPFKDRVYSVSTRKIDKSTSMSLVVY